MAKFVLADEPTFTWDVEIRVPAKGGTFQVQKIRCEFKVLSLDHFANQADQAVDRDEANKTFLSEAWIGWADGDVTDEDGAAIPFSPETRDRLLNIPYVLRDMFSAYREAVFKGEKAKRGN